MHLLLVQGQPALAGELAAVVGELAGLASDVGVDEPVFAGAVGGEFAAGYTHALSFVADEATIEAYHADARHADLVNRLLPLTQAHVGLDVPAFASATTRSQG